MQSRQTLGEAFDPRTNSFTVLRLVPASTVAWVQAISFAGGTFDPIGWLDPHRVEASSSIAVMGFFIISGFLVTRSYVRSPSTLRYLWHRLLRIFPRYWACLVATVVVTGPLMVLLKRGSLSAYFGADVNGPWSYVQANGLLTIRQ